MPKMSRLALLSFAPLVCAAPVFAQSPPPAGEIVPTFAAGGREGVIFFTAADFAASRPNTALDMIGRLPGFVLDTGDQVRGFAGAAGNVLIDGQRPTSKSESLSDILSRIGIDQVERIELIRGGAAGIDMQGRTVIANVIRKRVDTFTQVIDARAFVFAKTGHTIPGWNYQATLRTGEHQFEFQLSRGTSYDDSAGRGHRTTLDVPTNALKFQSEETEADGFVHSARGNYKGPLAGGMFSANALINSDQFKDEERFYNDSSDERYVSRSANTRGEIGLNYKRPVAEKFEAEVLGLTKYARGGGVNTSNDFIDWSLFNVRAKAGETIGRGVLRYLPSSTLTFEGGGEIAYNYRDQNSNLAVNGTPIPLPASTVKVEELRGEGFLQGTWRPVQQLSMEAGVRVERSTIKVTGVESRESTFVYPKPRLVATWSPTKDDQLRMRIERQVGQLNFGDFASNVNLNSGVLSAGNANLEPNKTWAYEAAFEKRFWGNAAAILTLRHEEISDVIDVAPFLVDTGTVDSNGNRVFRAVSGTGNIGSGANNVLDFNLTLPLAKLFVPGGELKIATLWQDSEVTDPTTKDKRRISNQRPNTINVNFRQDLPEQKLTYGFGWFYGWSQRQYLPTEVQKMDLHQFFSSFIEYKPTPRLTLRMELNNLYPYKFDIQRDEYNNTRDVGSLQTIEIEHRDSQVIGMFKVRWALG
jgi:hypothetical protein